MGKLLVLSEIDCLDFFHKRNVFPDEFYTDFDFFKNKSASFVDADIIVLFVGSCRFSKRHVLDLVRVLQKRAENENDKGINSVTIFTDEYLPKIGRYYKFQGNITNVFEYKGWRLVSKHPDILETMPRGSESTECKCYLTPHDNSDVSDLIKAYRGTTSTDEPLRGLIQKPDFSRISEI